MEIDGGSFTKHLNVNANIPPTALAGFLSAGFN